MQRDHYEQVQLKQEFIEQVVYPLANQIERVQKDGLMDELNAALAHLQSKVSVQPLQR